MDDDDDDDDDVLWIKTRYVNHSGFNLLLFSLSTMITNKWFVTRVTRHISNPEV